MSAFLRSSEGQVLDMCYVKSLCNVSMSLYLDTHLVHNSDSKQMDASLS